MPSLSFRIAINLRGVSGTNLGVGKRCYVGRAWTWVVGGRWRLRPHFKPLYRLLRNQAHETGYLKLEITKEFLSIIGIFEIFLFMYLV